MQQLSPKKFHIFLNIFKNKFDKNNKKIQSLVKKYAKQLSLTSENSKVNQMSKILSTKSHILTK